MPRRRSGDRRTSQSRSIVDNFRRGDKIQVFLLGDSLMEMVRLFEQKADS